MKRYLFMTILCLLGLFASLTATAVESFVFVTTYDAPSRTLTLSFDAAAKHYIYADLFTVRAAEPAILEPLEQPEPTIIFDAYSQEKREVHKHPFRASYRVIPNDAPSLDLTVHFQGCNAELCFFPETRTWAFPLHVAAMPASISPPISSPPSDTPEPATNWRTVLQSFTVTATGSGYYPPGEFLNFLAQGQKTETSPLAQRPAAWLLVLLGGLLLNLTPCVLPMIPVNLTIIGAGVRAGSRRRGFLLGGIYGLGMALAYGALGLVVILTQSAFGSLNASPWFNAGIAAIFFLMALAMFDVFHLDLSFLLQGGPEESNSQRSALWISFTMGVVSALLAGACVAPVVISVLIWAGDLFASGAIVAGLLLPFLLGLGMALPWPFAGAGLSFLPKPGRWMVWIRNGFGVVILVLAAYYGNLAYHLFTAASTVPPKKAATDQSPAPDQLENERLTGALVRAATNGRPVLIDFWATWCKNCLSMDALTFQDPDVVTALAHFEFVKYQAEQPNAPETRAVLNHFRILGLPSYVILHPIPQ